MVKALSTQTAVQISRDPHEFQVGKAACLVTTASEGRSLETPRAS